MKPKVAFYWCASCGGCEEAIVDLNEEILNVVQAVDIVFWPVALDFKEKDVQAMEDGGIDIAFINGAIRTTEQRRMAVLLRKKSRLVVAFGSCAQLGGIPGLANLTTREAILREVYGTGPRPAAEFHDNGHTLTLPTLFDSVFALERAIPVDYYVPGCPPSQKIIAAAIGTLLGETLPLPGSVLAPDRAMCDECPRRDTHPEELHIDHFRRVPEAVIDEHTCILAQGIACLGPATRSGCGSRCINGNMPCTGCFGPTSKVRDYGAKALCSIASIVASSDSREIDKVFDGLPDPVGLFYRYSLPSSFLERRRPE